MDPLSDLNHVARPVPSDHPMSPVVIELIGLQADLPAPYVLIVGAQPRRRCRRPRRSGPHSGKRSLLQQRSENGVYDRDEILALGQVGIADQIGGAGDQGRRHTPLDEGGHHLSGRAGPDPPGDVLHTVTCACLHQRPQRGAAGARPRRRPRPRNGRLRSGIPRSETGAGPWSPCARARIRCGRRPRLSTPGNAAPRREAVHR